MSARPAQSGAVVPAQLAFLAVYNPSLGNTDETLHDQIVFYWSRKFRGGRRQGNGDGDEGQDNTEEKNEKLRQIGLAQGMVEFARSFSQSEPVNSVETEKSRIVLYELEPSWWILASIDLTRLPTIGNKTKPTADSESPSIEYSAREVSPPQLLIQQLRRAHTNFLFHHGTSLSELYSRIDRTTFCSNLQRFFYPFARTWDVLLHGNPAVDVFGGIKMAGSGELGVGVGEEDRGSGEREVLEGFVGRIDGLVDLVVSRFGDPPLESKGDDGKSNAKGKNKISVEVQPQWGGLGSRPGPKDGAIFLGVGAVARSSLRDITNWMEDLYEYGESAYGVDENPTSTRRRRRRKQREMPNIKFFGAIRESKKASRAGYGLRGEGIKASGSERENSQHRVPPPIFPPVETLKSPTKADNATHKGSNDTTGTQHGEENDASSAYGTDKLMKYLTLGYGSAWGPTNAKPKAGEVEGEPSQQEFSAENIHEPTNTSPIQHIEPEPEPEQERLIVQKREKTVGYFLVGLTGDPESEEEEAMSTEREISQGADSNKRILLRTVRVDMGSKYYKDRETTPGDPLDKFVRASIPHPASTVSNGSSTGVDSSIDDPHKRKKCRVVVYVNQPFIFTFLFDANSESLSFPTFYRSLHHQLGPLKKPLLASTSHILVPPLHTTNTPTRKSTQPIHDLVYDPQTLTIHCSIPNIPDPIGFPSEAPSASDIWTRMEALNVHQQILNTYISTRRRPQELERTCKTSRGWWVVWMRLPQGEEERRGSLTTPGRENYNNPFEQQLEVEQQEFHKEAFLVRKSSDQLNKRIGALSGKDNGGAQGAAVGLAEGMGIDPRKYIESLLSLNR